MRSKTFSPQLRQLTFPGSADEGVMKVMVVVKFMMMIFMNGLFEAEVITFLCKL